VRIYKPTFADRKTGKQRRTQRWYCDFLDANRTRWRIPAGCSKTREAAEAFGNKLDQLVVCQDKREDPGQDLDKWIRKLPEHTQQTLGKIGLINTMRYLHAMAPLTGHLQDFGEWLTDTPIPGRGRKRTTHYVEQVMKNLDRIVTDCEFKFWHDIKIEAMDRFMGRMTENRSQRTQNGYLLAIKQFCDWMVESGRAVESPVKKLKLIKVRKQIKRRGLQPEEVNRLIEATVKEPPRWGLTGVQRAIIYVTAIETGYRIRELSNLRIADFDFDEQREYAWRTPAVRLDGRFTKNRLDAEQAIRRTRAIQLKAWFQDRQPDELAFKIPGNTYCTRMLRSDLAAANIPVVNAAREVLTFHGLRHTLGNLLDDTTVSLKARMNILRHSTEGNLTLGIYTDSAPLVERRDAIERMPEIPWPVEIQRQQEQVTQKVG